MADSDSSNGAPARVRLFVPRHNTTAYLVIDNAPVNQVFIPVINFFIRSRIYHSLVLSVDSIYEDHMVDFWSSAVFRPDLSPHCIQATIDNQEIRLTEQMIRDTILFDDQPEARNFIPRQYIDGLLVRMGAVRPDRETQIRKNHVCPHWRFLMHTLIACLSPRKGGLDGMSYQLGALMTALIENRPFNFSHFIFSNLQLNIGSVTGQYFMYPRFLQLIFDRYMPNIARRGKVLKYTSLKKRAFSDCRLYKKRAVPPTTPLFGHIIDENYQPPAIYFTESDSDSDSESTESDNQEEMPPVQEHVDTPPEIAQRVDEQWADID